MVVFGYAWGGPIGLGLRRAAGRSSSAGLVIANTWAWPDDRLRVRLFAALMGGPLSPLLVDRLDLMQRVYLPLNLKRGRLTDAERAAYEGPFSGGRRSVMRVFPREILRSRAYLEEVRSNLPRLADVPAVIVWPDSDPGFGDAELAHWQSLFPAAPTVRPRTDRPVHRRGRARGRRRRRDRLVARRPASIRRKGSGVGVPGAT